MSEDKIELSGVGKCHIEVWSTENRGYVQSTRRTNR